jgi:uncharacterized protein (DUF2141 family)
VKWIVILAIGLCYSFVKGQTTTVQLTIKGVTELKGNLMIAVYESANKFPEFGEGDINIVHKVNSRTPRISIPNLAIGKTYALAIFHDVNENEYLDKNFLGMPEEKYGFSNDARATFGPPYYSEASIKVSPAQQIKISIH